MSSFNFETITVISSNFGDNMSWQEVQVNLTFKFRHESSIPLSGSKMYCEINYNAKCMYVLFSVYIIKIIYIVNYLLQTIHNMLYSTLFAIR